MAEPALSRLMTKSSWLALEFGNRDMQQSITSSHVVNQSKPVPNTSDRLEERVSLTKPAATIYVVQYKDLRARRDTPNMYSTLSMSRTLVIKDVLLVVLIVRISGLPPAQSLHSVTTHGHHGEGFVG